jgi:transcriptional regulator of acetoin/glycerol metabolism
VASLTFRSAKQAAIANFEKAYLNRLIISTGGNVSKAARVAGKDRHVFRRLLRKHGIEFTSLISSLRNPQ